MPKKSAVEGTRKEASRSTKSPKKKSALTTGMKTQIRDLIEQMLQQHLYSDNFEERVRSANSGGISAQDARETAAGEVRAYHRSNALTGKIEEETLSAVEKYHDSEKLNKKIEKQSEKLSPGDLRKMLLSAFDQYHKSPQLEKRIRKVMGDSIGVTRKEVEKEILDNLKKYHRSEQLRKKIRDIAPTVPTGQGGVSLPEEQILELVREEMETVFESEALSRQIEQNTRPIVERLLEREMDRLLDAPEVEDRIREICRSLAEETSINLPVVVPSDLRTMVQEEIDADHEQHPIPEGHIPKEAEIQSLAKKMAGKEITKLLQSAELRALIQTQAKMTTEKAIAPLPVLTREDVVKIAGELDLTRESRPHAPSSDAMKNLIREISGEVAQKLVTPLPTWSDLEQVSKAGGTLPAQPAANVAQQVKALVQEALHLEPLPEGIEEEEMPKRRRRVRRKYRR